VFDIAGLLPSVAKLAALRELCLSHCVLAGPGDSHASALAATLGQLASLSKVKLTSNQVSGGLRVVLSALAQLPQLADVELADNAFWEIQAAAAFVAMPALTRLTLQGR
jgi:Ran GTPase-activating protein (RanGAP) involved in mRNA processing and transport